MFFKFIPLFLSFFSILLLNILLLLPLEEEKERKTMFFQRKIKLNDYHNEIALQSPYLYVWIRVIIRFVFALEQTMEGRSNAVKFNEIKQINERVRVREQKPE